MLCFLSGDSTYYSKANLPIYILEKLKDRCVSCNVIFLNILLFIKNEKNS